MWIRIAALAVLLSAPLAGRTDPRLFSPGGAIESSTETITEPLVEGGMLLAKSCPACRSMPLRLNANTPLFIGKRQVSLVEFNQFLESGGTHGLGIFYDKAQHTVTRLVIFAKQPSHPARN